MTRPADFVVKQLKRAPDSRRCTFGGLTAYGVLDIQDEMAEDESGGAAKRASHVLALPTASFPALAIDSAVMVYPDKNATGTPTSYTVRQRFRVEDGLVTHYHCVPT